MYQPPTSLYPISTCFFFLRKHQENVSHAPVPSKVEILKVVDFPNIIDEASLPPGTLLTSVNGLFSILLSRSSCFSHAVFCFSMSDFCSSNSFCRGWTCWTSFGICSEIVVHGAPAPILQTAVVVQPDAAAAGPPWHIW